MYPAQTKKIGDFPRKKGRNNKGDPVLSFATKYCGRATQHLHVETTFFPNG